MDLRIQPQTVHSQTAARLRDAIMRGVFRPGARLVEADLCQMMGVSRTSIREALRLLEAERLITRVPNRGPAVAEITWAQAQEIYDVRALLEGEAAALLAARVTPAELETMRAALKDFETAVAQGAPLEQLASTERFYKVILDGCGNGIIAELLQGLLARITFLRAQSMSRSGRPQQSVVELRAIYKAVASRKPDAARQAAVRHVQAACAAARKVYEATAADVPPRKKAASA